MDKKNLKIKKTRIAKCEISNCSNLNSDFYHCSPSFYKEADISLQCRCCFKVINNKNSLLINETFQEIHNELMNFELDVGRICKSCYNSITTFKIFRDNIHKIHEDNKQITRVVEGGEEFEVIELNEPQEELLDEIQPKKRKRQKISLTKSEAKALKQVQEIMALPIDQIKCQYCSVKVKTRREIKFHLKKDHSFQCSDCLVKFPYHITLVRHIASIHANKPQDTVNPPRKVRSNSSYIFNCKICFLKFSTEETMMRHMMKHDEEEVARVLEDVKPDLSKIQLKKEVILLPRTMKVCSECNKFYKEENLKDHKIKVHGIED